MHEARAREGRRVSSKSPSRVRDGGEGVAGRNEREKCFPDEAGFSIFPPGNSDTLQERKDELVWPDLTHFSHALHPSDAILRGHGLQERWGGISTSASPKPTGRTGQPQQQSGGQVLQPQPQLRKRHVQQRWEVKQQQPTVPFHEKWIRQ